MVSDSYAFMGSLIIQEVVKDLLSKGLDNAKVLLLAGSRFVDFACVCACLCACSCASSQSFAVCSQCIGTYTSTAVAPRSEEHTSELQSQR